jgi:hypothetical protein
LHHAVEKLRVDGQHFGQLHDAEAVSAGEPS